jgi:cell wall-associated NlpC family hydrolase
MHDLIKQLVALGAAVVVAAGNDGQELLDVYPSCFEEPITVAAVYNDGRKAEFSVWHNEVDFAEIGVGIPRLTNAGAMQNGSGTSFATPIVCNKLAKIWSAAPALTEAQLYEQAKANCQDLGAAGRDPYFGWGWIASVDAQAAVTPPVENPGETKDDPPVTAQNRLIYLTTPRMSGADVYALELQLQALGYDCKMTAVERSSRAGIFGPACDAAVRQFQHDYNVDVYGKACPHTLAALAAAQSEDSAFTLADQFVSWLKTQVGNIYVWGAQGENLTDMTDEAGRALKAKTPEAWIRGMEDEDSDYARALAFYKKRLAAGQNPILAYDCGGLIVHWLHIAGLLDMDEDLSSRGLYRACTPITRAELKPGNLLFRDNGVKIHHVGVFVGDNKAIEAMGRDQGVVMRDINASGAGYWTNYGQLNCLQ